MRNHVIIYATRPRGSEARASSYQVYLFFFESHASRTFADDILHADRQQNGGK